MLILYFHDFKEVSATTELATVSQRRNPVNGSSNPEPTGRPLWSGCCPRWAGRCGASPPGSHAPATARPRSAGSRRRSASDGPHCSGSYGPGSLAPSPRRLLIQAGLLDASSQMPQGRLPGQPDNQVPRTVGRGPVGEQAGQVRVHRDGPAPAALAAADQQGTGRDVYAPPFQGHGLADAQPRSPHDERRRPRSARESKSRSTCWGFQ